jgi:hypothetical protein
MRSYNKILAIAVIVLVIINIALLICMLRGKQADQSKRQPAPSAPFETMARELNMTEQQKTQYQILRDQHFSNVRPILDSIREIRKDFLKLMQSTIAYDSEVAAYSHRIAEKQAVVDRMTLDHFRKVRALFIGDQQKKFDDFIQKIMLRRGNGQARKDSIDRK